MLSELPRATSSPRAVVGLWPGSRPAGAASGADFGAAWRRGHTPNAGFPDFGDCSFVFAARKVTAMAGSMAGSMAGGAGMNVSGLRLLDGALILKVMRGRWVEPIRVLEGESFDLERSALELRFPFEVFPSAVLPRLWNLVEILRPQRRFASSK